MFVSIIITVSITPQIYGCFLIHQNFLLFFSSKVHFFCFSVFGGTWSGFIFSGFPVSCYQRFIVPVCVRFSCCLYLVWFVPSGCFLGLGVYNNYISLLKNKSLLVFRFFLAGHLQGHFIGAFRGALWRGIL